MKNVFLALIAFCPYLLFSQNVQELDMSMGRVEVKTLEGTIAIGLSAYEGDLLSFDDEDLGIFSDIGLSIAIGVKKHFNDKLTIGLTYTNLSISADEVNFAEVAHKNRAYSFENNLHEISVLAEYYPFAHKEWKLQPYVYGGPGFVFGSPDTDFSSEVDAPNNTRINEDINEVKKSSFTLPVGFGLKMDLTDRMSISAQASIRWLTNDYLDGVSVAGNSDVGDYFGDGALKLGYRF